MTHSTTKKQEIYTKDVHTLWLSTSFLRYSTRADGSETSQLPSLTLWKSTLSHTQHRPRVTCYLTEKQEIHLRQNQTHTLLTKKSDRIDWIIERGAKRNASHREKKLPKTIKDLPGTRRLHLQYISHCTRSPGVPTAQSSHFHFSSFTISHASTHLHFTTLNMCKWEWKMRIRENYVRERKSVKSVNKFVKWFIQGDAFSQPPKIRI